MIIFKKLKFKNFLSTGDKFTEIDLIKSKSTLIVGHNGAGKSTMLDALSFALFGKAHRNINKPQLVNSINKKNCVVSVEFQIGKNNFIVERGIAPTIFKIWKNGEMLNQSSHSKEYQKILEQNIIKLNHKSFHQIVVLGSSSFIPFMQLPAAQRRGVIEDLLDINVFSKMNSILKEKNSILKENIKNISHTLDITTTKINSQKKYIKDLTELKSSHIEDKLGQISDHHKDIEKYSENNKKLLDEMENIEYLSKELNKVHDQKQSVNQSHGEIVSKIQELVKNTKFYENNDHCLSCDQEISQSLKNNKISNAKNRAKELNSLINKSKDKSSELNSLIDDFSSRLETARNIQQNVNSNIQSISVIQKSIKKIEDELNKASTSEDDVSKANQELESLNSKKENLVEEKFTSTDQYSYNIVMAEMLKDTGIKTKVIKQYVPVINKYINSYLQVLDFFVSFNLDESFVEVIRSRHRDDFSYDSFSEGEKQRIDLALLFTWRMIAKMKNSVATNLLVLDETFDSSLDHDGVENLMKILYTLDEGTNVFVISHKGEILEGKFDNKIEFIREKNFSSIK